MTTPQNQVAGLLCYQIKINGYLDDDFVAGYCPQETVIEHDDCRTTLANILTDQSGIVGLIRQLHNLGCSIVEMTSRSPVEG